MFNRKSLMVAVSVAISSMATGAMASGAAEEIARINEQIAIQSAILQDLEVKAKIAGKQQEIDRLRNAPGGSSSDTPVVRSIEGSSGRLFATLAMGGGVSQTVGKGDKFGEWTVVKIDVNAVFLNRRKNTIRIGFGSEPPVSSHATSGQGGGTPAGFPR